MKNTRPNSIPISPSFRSATFARFTLLLPFLLCAACASVPREGESNQLIRMENQTLSRIRVYVAFDTSPEVRVLLGTLDANRTEFLPLPSVFIANRGLVVTCERGRAGALQGANMRYQTTSVALPKSSILAVMIREPIDYSDFTVYSEK